MQEIWMLKKYVIDLSKMKKFDTVNKLAVNKLVLPVLVYNLQGMMRSDSEVKGHEVMQFQT